MEKNTVCITIVHCVFVLQLKKKTDTRVGETFLTLLITPDHIRYDSGKWVIWHNVKHSVLIGIFDSCHYLLSISEIVNWHFCSIWPIFIQIVWLIALTSSHFIFLALVKNIVGSYINIVCYCAWNLMYVRLCKRLISDINKWNW